MENTDNEYGYSYGTYDTKYKQVDFRKSNRRIIAAFLMIVLFIVLASVLFVRIGSTYYKSKQTGDYQDRTASITKDLKYNLDAINDKFTTNRLKILFSPDDILIFSYNIWTYELYVNNTQIKTTSEITISPNDKIYIKEIQKETALPKSFVDAGRLTRGDANDSIINHFSLSTKGYKIVNTKNGLVNIYTIENANLQSGKTILLSLSDQLAKRLMFNRDIIELKIK